MAKKKVKFYYSLDNPKLYESEVLEIDVRDFDGTALVEFLDEYLRVWAFRKVGLGWEILEEKK